MAATTTSASTPTVIDGADMASAISDPKVAKLVTKALGYGARLKAAGKDHSLRSADRRTD